MPSLETVRAPSRQREPVAHLLLQLVQLTALVLLITALMTLIHLSLAAHPADALSLHLWLATAQVAVATVFQIGAIGLRRRFADDSGSTDARNLYPAAALVLTNIYKAGYLVDTQHLPADSQHAARVMMRARPRSGHGQSSVAVIHQDVAHCDYFCALVLADLLGTQRESSVP